MLLNIAWRNLWRNRRRSLIILTSIVVGVMALVALDSLMKGLMTQMLKNAISSQVSHIQIHKKGFNENRKTQSVVPNREEVEKALGEANYVKAWSKRAISSGMINSAGASSGVTIIGALPNSERRVTNIADKIVEGEYLSGNDNKIVIGKDISEKLEVGVGDKIVLMAAQMDGSVGYGMYRVAGVFETGSSEFDKTHVYIPLAQAQTLLDLGDEVHEYAMIVNNEKGVDEDKAALAEKIDGEYEILTYKELLPIIMAYMDMVQASMIITYLIFIVAILFGVINSMLMSVMERIKEFGVLMSIGMKGGKIFFMVVQESFLLGIFGTVVGFALGYSLFLLMKDGVDLSIYKESLASFGTGSVIYPVFDASVILNAFIFMPIATALGAIYPALKAVKLQPTDAMRHV